MASTDTTRARLDELVRKAQWSGVYSQWVSPTERTHLTVPVTPGQVERFAQLVAEECAKECEELHDPYIEGRQALECAAAIRAKFGVKA